ncbi:MAG: hypothetical protein ABIU20_09760, partial [Blastocatellia bacterium]
MINTRNTSTILFTGRKKRSRFSLGRSVTLTSRVIASLGRFSVRFGLVALAACFVLSALWSTQVFSHGGAKIASAEESIGLFSSASLTTPKTTFNLGEKAWALETGAPLPYLGTRQRRI